MQLGIRWNAGESVHQSVPEQLHSAIAHSEKLHPDARSWTLTWLEGRPRCALDDVLTLTIDALGNPITEGKHSAYVHDEDDDDWLNDSGGTS